MVYPSGLKLLLAAALLIVVAPENPVRANNGRGTAAALGFAVGAVAGTLLAPPRPPVVVHHHRYGGPRYGYGPYPPPPPQWHYAPYPDYVYDYPPPMIQREIIYREAPPAAPVMMSPPVQLGAPASSMQPVPQTQYHAPSPAQQPTFYAPSTSDSPSATRPAEGTVVDRLPTMAKRVEHGGVAYFEQEGVFYLPIRIGNEPKFVVVVPR